MVLSNPWAWLRPLHLAQVNPAETRCCVRAARCCPASGCSHYRFWSINSISFHFYIMKAWWTEGSPPLRALMCVRRHMRSFCMGHWRQRPAACTVSINTWSGARDDGRSIWYQGGLKSARAWRQEIYINIKHLYYFKHQHRLGPRTRRYTVWKPETSGPH